MIHDKSYKGRGCDVPPARQHVEIYFLQKGLSLQASREFYQHYCNKQWARQDGQLIQDWKRLAWQWIWNS
jgi:hypothetical protein